MGVVARLLVPVYYWKESVFVYGHCIDNTVHLTETRLSGIVDSYIKWKHQAFDQPCLIYIRDNVACICLFDGTTIEAVPNCLPSAVYPRTTDFGVVVNNESCLLMIEDCGRVEVLPMFDHHIRFHFEIPQKDMQKYAESVVKIQNDSIERLISNIHLVLLKNGFPYATTSVRPASHHS